MPLAILPIILKGALALNPGLTAQDAVNTIKHAAQTALSATPVGFLLGQMAGSDRVRDAGTRSVEVLFGGATIKNGGIFRKEEAVNLDKTGHNADKSNPEEAAWCARGSNKGSIVYDCSTVNERGVTISADPQLNGSFSGAAIGRSPVQLSPDFSKTNPAVTTPQQVFTPQKPASSFVY